LIDTLHVSALGSTRYRDGLALMDALVAARAAGETQDWLLYPDHEPVLTVGRSPSPGNVRVEARELARARLEVVEVPRGGDVTWHGPGQRTPVSDTERRSLGGDVGTGVETWFSRGRGASSGRRLDRGAHRADGRYIQAAGRGR